MQRYFVQESHWQENKVTITEEDAHHIKKVMRMTEGDSLIAVHPEGKAYKVSIESVGESIICVVREEITDNKELPQQVTVVQAIGKADKVEWVIQKATELGVSRIIPFQATRSVAKWDHKKQDKKVARFEKIAKEAAEQSERVKVPHVHRVLSLQEVIEETKDYDFRVFAYENEVRNGANRKLSEHIKEMTPGTEVCVIIGPEGGFSPEEADELYQSGFTSVRLGKRILRMETAPLYFLSALSYEWEE
ncbi:16S rRNA (uracil(1498)-N(3))-methyltransferase [Salimicrobium halophilum]|uniref:Ribosomal RNA small subunit methyltransferase E n=1 Tax=Salimicrobium halophilum TaxID=86666 RepID=A0A1G8PQC9_9BACI|nr:16S rRNA (uracil(1498)-N(3))-methyltransferase [Salimicrobium halophilum]SDI94476.1 16S rRNA (uracil1498-N3)-methyltransferase [Salimicrobium halophilum]